MRNDDGMAALGSGHHVIDGKHAYSIGKRRRLACEETDSQAVNPPLDGQFSRLHKMSRSPDGKICGNGGPKSAIISMMEARDAIRSYSLGKEPSFCNPDLESSLGRSGRWPRAPYLKKVEKSLSASADPARL